MNLHIEAPATERSHGAFVIRIFYHLATWAEVSQLALGSGVGLKPTLHLLIAPSTFKASPHLCPRRRPHPHD